jgi:hypothetical protein
MPPPFQAPAEPDKVRQDPHIGLITGAVSFTKDAEAHRPGIGVVAVGMSAVICVLALVATGSGSLVTGSAVALACVAAVVVANRLAIHKGLRSKCRFAMRAETGRTTTWTLLGASAEGVLRAGDLVRIVPGPRGRARAVEVLAGPDGPILRRLSGRALLAAVQWAGLALAAALLAMTTAVLYGVF